MASSTDGGFLTFYRAYVHTALHTATTVALTALGLLTFVHWGFAVAAIAVYVLPPVYLYVSGTTLPSAADTDESPVDERSTPGRTQAPDADRVESDSPGGRSDDGHDADGDTDSDADDGDSDSDSDGVDTDSDSDSDDGDTDSDTDSNDGDSDSDSDTDDSPTGTETRWQSVAAPTDRTLRGVVGTTAGTYAVGDGGVLLGRRGDGWERLVDDGPGAAGQTLHGVASTADGRGVWVAGDGGALGRYDAETGRVTDHSAPADDTNNLTDVAVTGDAGDETVLLANGSGAVRRGRYDGARVAWADPVTPGSGSSIAALAVTEDAAYCCDTNASVFVSRDDGRSWSRLGVEDAGCAFRAVVPFGGDRVAVAASDGRLFEFDGSVWTPRRVVDGLLSGLAMGAATGHEVGVACGPDGTLVERAGDGWERRLVATDADLHDAAVGPDGRAVVVGDGGAVLERVSR
ncbi:WD40/YVTN/BNR-like repeat-containing protein [Halomarina rubra]|uniref:WD40/YVTN/BNR-like repeat-containing protein n=1 Tax=Halomarina rubra TaxID=2071873 RepID=A0ABD6ARK2_9EURY|nr:hypothetical protein [Halomarina rubra]